MLLSSTAVTARGPPSSLSLPSLSSLPTLLLLLLWVNHGPVLAQDTGPLLHSVVMDQDGKYIMSWTPGPEDVIIEVQAETRGYVGLGFSPTGGMKGADIVLGWVDEANIFQLSDRYGVGDQTPIVDDSEDVTLISGRRNDTHTTLRFKRPWNSCDEEHDMAITFDTTRVIFAYDDDTPDPTSLAMNYHDVRGTRSLYLREPQMASTQPEEDVEFWDVLAPDVLLPADLATLYWCKLYKMPPLEEKNHFIGYKPLIAPSSAPFVHHMILYECRLENSTHHLESWVDHKGAQCYTPNMPISWRGCGTPLVAWAVGSEGGMLPPHTGTPLGENWDGGTYFMMEVHYNNPQKKSGIRDSSGLRVMHTTKLRTYDTGTLTVGHSVEPMQIIAPQAPRWITVGHCSGDCTSRTLPAGGIKVFGSTLHSHLLGRAITLQHIRNGKELPPIVTDYQYDFNYQQERMLPQETVIMPGDHMIASCYYDSTARQTPSFGGFATQDEMCLVFLMYYPRIPFSDCLSGPDVSMLLAAMGVEELYEKPDGSFGPTNFSPDQIDPAVEQWQKNNMASQDTAGANGQEMSMSWYLHKIIIKSPPALNNKSVLEVLYTPAFWDDPEHAIALQKVFTNGRYHATCLNTGRTAVPGAAPVGSMPDYEVFQPLAGPCAAQQTGPSYTVQKLNGDNNHAHPTAVPPLALVVALSTTLLMLI